MNTTQQDLALTIAVLLRYIYIHVYSIIRSEINFNIIQSFIHSYIHSFIRSYLSQRVDARQARAGTLRVTVLLCFIPRLPRPVPYHPGNGPPSHRAGETGQSGRYVDNTNSLTKSVEYVYMNDTLRCDISNILR